MSFLSDEVILHQVNQQVYTEEHFPIFNGTSVGYILVALNYINDKGLPKEDYKNLLQTLINFDLWLETNTPNYWSTVTNYRESIKEFLVKHQS